MRNNTKHRQELYKKRKEKEHKKLTKEDIKQQLLKQLEGADDTMQLEDGLTEYDHIEQELQNLEFNPEEYVACANCKASDACRYCGYGDNEPPMGI